jgi:DNA-binding NarL/FixJ family response regulator
MIDNRGVATPPETAEAPEGRRAPKVVLADDDVLLREGVASLLDRSGFDVVGQAGNGVELLAQVRSARPELAIIDIRMPPGHATEGLQAARLIRAELPGTAIIVLSAHVEVEEAMELLASGEGTGYLLKSRVTDVAEFIETVGRIAAGGSVVDPSLVQELIKARRRRDPLDVLSPRESEVLALMAEGASNAGIARRIFVTEGTVEKHVRSILTKLDLPESETEHRRVMAVLRFLEARLFLLAGSHGGIPVSRNAAAPNTWHHHRVSIRCLLVDDSDGFLTSARVLLEREGVTVVGVASNSAEALRRARGLRPDLILVDIGLGDESGFDLARLLAEDGQFRDAEVILISARAETDYAELIAESPAAGFLVKSELSARAIDRILGRTP